MQPPERTPERSGASAIPTPDAGLVHMAAQLQHMLDWPILFSREEVLGQLLAMTRRAFEWSGFLEEETERRALYEAIAEYVDVPEAPHV